MATNALRQPAALARPRKSERAQLDLFRALPGSMAPRDVQDLMAYPFFSLAKSKRLAPIDFKAGTITIRVEAVPEYGMATIWDADILIWAASQIVEARDAGLKTSRLMAATPYEILTFTGRGTSLRDYDRLKAALDRLQSTTVATSIRQITERRRHRFSWINEWKETADNAGRQLGIELILPDWFYAAVLDDALVLTIDQAYFSLTGGLERWLYRIVRKHGGRQTEGWQFDVTHLHAKSGIRLVLNQIGRRLTEELKPKTRRHRVLLMLDEFPALGRLDFFESALAFMAGYGLKAFLIAQSLNQIEKAYGQNNSILDNCHVRVSFATNDERTAKRVSDALGTATEMRAMRNYAGNRLAPWLGHLMVSRQETARPLLTPGEIMQLPPDDEIVMISGTHPIRANKARYFKDRRLAERILPPPKPDAIETGADQKPDDWTTLPLPTKAADPATTGEPAVNMGNGKKTPKDNDDPANAGIRREPELPEHEDIEPFKPALISEFAFEDGSEQPDDEAVRLAELRRQMGGFARQASLDPADNLGL